MREADEPFEFKCLQLKQPIGTFYTGVMQFQDLIKISYADIHRLETETEMNAVEKHSGMREIEVYTGIQRELSKNRVKEIGDYVNLVDATFPTSVILHIDPEDATFDSKTSTLSLPYRDNIAKVLDGQHRIAGLAEFEGKAGDFDVIVTIFVGMEIEDQALVFATINKTQTKVNNSLVANLFTFATHRSPQRTCHTIVRALNQKKESPFFEKIKILGTAADTEKETITQATFSEGLIKYISKNPMSDRDIYKRGKVPAKYEGKELENRPLRNLFIDEKDGEIATIIWEYFAAVRETWPTAWDKVKADMILNRSTGFIALMRLFKDVYLSYGSIGAVVPRDHYKRLFQKCSLVDSDFNKQKFVPGSSGQVTLYTQLRSEIGLGDDG
ncbi:MAG: DGQHR domain-containing protein [Pyrinomonadaceae bacterium]|nr:DGQHR domain-containing protein [Pyrinomonadaceae bacterium]MBP6211684.1 DGQHR domain-containing protein [Pyrinomonadaceae bacterium]